MHNCSRCALMACALLLLPCSALAQHVLYVDDSAPGANDGSSWSNAYNDLQQALAAAQSGDEVRVAAGVYRPTATTDRLATFALQSGVAVYGGYAGAGAPDPDARDVSAYETTLSGDIGAAGVAEDNVLHVVTTTGTDATAVLDGFTIRDGYANGFDYVSKAWMSRLNAPGKAEQIPPVRLSIGSRTTGIAMSRSGAPVELALSDFNDAGAGVYNDGGSPTLRHLTITANSAGAGGGMYSYGGWPSIIGSAFVSNEAGIGGGLYSEEDVLAMDAVVFRANTAGVSGGGAYASGSGAGSVLADVEFESNVASFGSGLYNASADLTVQDGTFLKNADAVDGAGLYHESGRLRISGGAFHQNNAVFNGAGLFSASGDVGVADALFDDNQVAYTGGGVAVWGGALRVERSAFSGNLAVRVGGAIAANGDVFIASSTFFNNAAGLGGALSVGGNTVHVANCVFERNKAFIGYESGDGAGISAWNADLDVVSTLFVDNYSEGRGAIYVGGDSQARVTNATIVGNRADESGAGIQADLSGGASLRVANAILWGNTAPADAAYAGTGAATFAASVIEGGIPASAIDGGGNTDLDPLFADAAGGDFRLLHGSPALELGAAADLPADLFDLDDDGDTTEPIPYDLDGGPRVVDYDGDGDARLDAGTYETPSAAGTGGTCADAALRILALDADGDPDGEDVTLGNDDERPASLTGCSFVALDPFTERVVFAENLDGLTIPPRGRLNVELTTGNTAIPDGPGAVAVVMQPSVAVGTPVTALTEATKAAWVYLDENTVFGSMPAPDASKSPEPLVELMRSVAADVPGTYALGGNYPNPFNPTTTISFDLPERAHVRLAVFDVLGREVARLADGPLVAGRHALRFEASDLPSGTYLYRLEAGAYVAVRRMMLLK